MADRVRIFKNELDSYNEYMKEINELNDIIDQLY